MTSLSGLKVVLGVSGGIAAFKAILILRLLTKAGADCRVALTPAAAKFIPALTFEALSGQPVYVDLWQSTKAGGEVHVELAKWADVIVIAPATANFISQMVHGACEDLLSAIAMASTAPTLLAPAMHHNMWNKPAVRRNIAQLQEDGVYTVGPVVGELATGEGQGRMAEPEAIVEMILTLLTPKDLVGQRVLITAGPTREAIDPVRYISNRSSGKMGYALARMARRRGADTLLISGPTQLPCPQGVSRISVESAGDMFKRVTTMAERVDIVIMAAAVADFTPAKAADHKIKKGESQMNIPLRATRDILAHLGAEKGDRILVGFAMETEKLEERAKGKLQRKKCDMIVANHLFEAGAGFGVDTNRVTLFTADGRQEGLPLLSKEEVADAILDKVTGLLAKRVGEA